jgi:hypothetical protein
MITMLPVNVKFIFSSIHNHQSILSRFKFQCSRRIDYEQEQGNNILEITELDKAISIQILQDWLRKEKRSLNKEQWSILNSMFETAKLFPLYIKLIYDFIVKWNSFDKPDSEFIKKCINIDKSIEYLFKLLEKNHGKLLFPRSIIYMTSFKNGISECEIEDILSLDDDVLYEVFEFHAPPVRKLPICLWSRIKNALQGYMVEKEINDTRVIYWYHRRFIEVANSYYISKLNSSQRSEIFQNVIDFFKETWKNKPKPFKYNEYVAKKLKLNSQAEAIRETTMQPTILKNASGVAKFNKRKICELPNFILQLTSNLAIPLFCEQIVFDYSFLSGLFHCLDYREITDILGNASNNSSYNLNEEVKMNLKEFKVIQMTFLQCSFTLTDYPNSALIQILSRLLKLYGYSKYFTKLVDEYDKYSLSMNSLIVPYQYLQSPGDDLIFQLEKHNYPITCTAIGGDNDMYVFTVSNKLNVVNLQTVSDVCNLQIKNTFVNFNFMVVYFETSFETASQDFKNILGGVIFANENELLSYSFEFMHSSITFTNDIINNVFIISKTNLIVSFENKPYIDIRDLIKLELKTRHEFSNNVKSIICNTYHDRINQTSLFEKLEIFLVILFQSNEMVINKIDNLNLIKLFSINSPGYEIIDYKFNNNPENFYSYDIDHLIITISNGSIMKVPIKIKNQKSNNDLINIESSYFLVKFERNRNIVLKIIQINDEMSIFIGSNKHIYVIIDYKNLNMIEIEGCFDNAIFINKQRIGCVSNGYFTLYSLVHNANNLDIYYFVPLFSIDAHNDRITFSFIKDFEMMLTTSLDSTLKIFLISKLNDNDKFRLKFDKNENELNDFMVFDSNYILCRLQNTK